MNDDKLGFIAGYACAISTLIDMNRVVDSHIRELFHAGLKYDLKWLRRNGVDEHDISVFKLFRKELTR